MALTPYDAALDDLDEQTGAVQAPPKPAPKPPPPPDPTAVAINPGDNTFGPPPQPREDPLLTAWKAREGREIGMRSSVINSEDLNPQRANEILRLSQLMGLGPELVRQDFDRYAAQVSVNGKPYTQMMRETPATAGWLAEEPTHAAAVSKPSELEKLGLIEYITKVPYIAAAKQLAAMKYAPLNLRAHGIGAPLTADERQEMAALKVVREMYGDMGLEKRWFMKPQAGQAELAAQLAGNIPRTAQFVASGALFGGGAGAAGGPFAPVSAPAGMVAGATAGFITASALNTYEIERSDSLDEMLQFVDPITKQKIDPAIAREASHWAGLLNAAVEIPQTAMLIEGLGVGAGLRALMGVGARELIRDALVMPTVRAAMAQAAKTYALTLTGEAGQEALQRENAVVAMELAKYASGLPQQMRTTGAGTDQEREGVLDRMVHEPLNEFVEALPRFALAMLPGPTLTMVHQVQRAQRAQGAKLFFDSLSEGVQQSEFATAMPQHLQKILQTAMKDGPVEHSYFDPATWQEYWTGQGLNPAAVWQQITGDRDQYEKALVEGQHLEMRTSEYAAYLAGTEHNGFLSKEIRLGDPLAMNYREGKAQFEELTARLTEEINAANEVAQAHGQNVQGQVEAIAGTAVAQRVGQAHQRFFSALMERAGNLPIFQQFGLKFMKGDPNAQPVPSGAPTQTELGPPAATATAETAPGAPARADVGASAGALHVDVNAEVQKAEQAMAAEAGQEAQPVTQALFPGHDPAVGLTPEDLAMLPQRVEAARQAGTLPALDVQAPSAVEPLSAEAAAQAVEDVADEDLTPSDSSFRTLEQGPRGAFPAGLTARVPGLGRLAGPQLNPEEKAKLRRDTAEALVEAFKELPPDEDFKAAALAGRAMRGWYRDATTALLTLFGPGGAIRFASLLAATSPRIQVRENLLITAAVWRAWHKAGRPRDRKTILRILDQATGTVREQGVLHSWRNNVVRVLSAPDSFTIPPISGPKVSSFARNLLGNVREVTLDVWMAIFARLDEDVFAGDLNVAKTDPGKGPSYLAYAAKVRRVAETLTEETGEEWTPSEVQETVWSWTKAIYEMAKKGKTSAETLLREGKLTDEAILKTPTFHGLLTNDPAIRKVLEEAGHAAGLDRLAEVFRGGGGAVRRAERAPGIHTPSPGLLRSARRLDLVRAQRAREADERAAAKRAARERSLEQGAVPLTDAAVQAFADEVRAGAGAALTHFDLHLLSPNELQLTFVAVAKAQQGQGLGTSVMQELLAYADEEGLRVSLKVNPEDTTYGTTSRARLVQFYKGFGFVENRGIYRDEALAGAEMYREPTIQAEDVERALYQPERESATEARDLPLRPDEAETPESKDERVLFQPMPGFYSRLTRAVEQFPQAKALGKEWKGAIKNYKGGTHPGELALTHVEDLDDAKVYTKDEVLLYLAANEVVVMPRVMAAQRPVGMATIADQQAQTDDVGRQRLAFTRRLIQGVVDEVYMVAEHAIMAQPIRARERGGGAIGWFADINIESALRAIPHWDETFGQWWSDSMYERRWNSHASEADAIQQAEAGRGEYATSTQRRLNAFVDQSRAQQYRDAEARAAGQAPQDFDALARQAIPDQFDTKEADAEPLYVGPLSSYTPQHSEPGGFGHQEVFLTVPQFALARLSSPDAGWIDGHPAYSAVKNPIVRIRTSIQTDPDGKQWLWIDEVQPPTKGQTRNVPEIFQNRKVWGGLAFKWALQQAAARGLAGVAWTPGEIQDRRWNLARVVKQIDWTQKPKGKAADEAALFVQRTDGVPVTVQFDDGEVRVLSWPSELPGMIVTGRVGVDRQALAPTRGYKLTHAQTGLAVGAATYQTVEEAQRAARGVQKALAAQGGDQFFLSLQSQADFTARTDREQRIALQNIFTKQAKLARTWLRKQARGQEQAVNPKAPRIIKLDLVNRSPIRLAVNAEGKIMGPDDPQWATTMTDRTDTAPADWHGQSLTHLVGDDLAQQIMGAESGKIADLKNVRVGGLMRLYSTDFPRLVNDLPAVKKAGVKTTTQAFTLARDRRNAPDPLGPPMDAEGNTIAPAVAMTPELKAQVEAGQALFQPLKGRGAGQARGVIRFKGNRQFHIGLLEKADLSTYLHESAHFFLEVLGDVADELVKQGPATLTESQKGVLQDYGALLGWFGVATREEVSDEHHEMFARGYEAHLMQAQPAVSPEIQSLYDTFRGWLKEVYSALTDLGVTLTPEVQDVMQRLLAGDAALQAEAAKSELAPLFTTPEMAGWSEAELLQYHALVKETSLESQRATDTRLQADVQRQRETAYQVTREKVRDEVSAEMAAKPVYKALFAVRYGTTPAGEALVPGQEAVPAKLDKDLIVAKYGMDRLRTLPRPYVYTVEHGLDPDVVAEQFGFSSGDAMLEAFSQAPPFTKAIEDETNTRMTEAHATIKTEAGLEEKARQAIANVKYEAVVRMELRALARLHRQTTAIRKAGNEALRDEKAERAYEQRWTEAETRLRIAMAEGYQQVEIDRLKDELAQVRQEAKAGAALVQSVLPSQDVLNEHAEQKIAATAVDQIRPNTYWAAARSASKRATEALAKQNYGAAIQAKQQELLNLALFREATRVKEEIAKREQAAREIVKKEKQAALALVGPSWREQVNGILARFEIVGVPPDSIKNRAPIDKWLAAMAGDGTNLELSDLVSDERVARPYGELPVAGFFEVTDDLAQILHAAKEHGRLSRNAEKRELNELAQDLAASAAAFASGKRKKKLESGLGLDSIKEGAAGFAAWQRKLASICRELDGGLDNGPFWRAIMRPINAMVDREAVMLEAATVRLDAALKLMTRQERANLNIKTFISAINDSLSGRGRLMVALNWGNEGNRQRTKDSFGWNDTQVKAILDTLSFNEWETVKAVWKAVSEYKAEIIEKQTRVYGVAPTMVEAAPFDTEHGEMPGGYFPIAWDPNQDPKLYKFEAAELAEKMMRGAFTASTTKRGYTRERRAVVKGRTIYLNTDVIFTHIAEVVHDLTHHETLMDVNKILRHPVVSQAIRDHYGLPVYKAMQSALQDIAAGDVPVHHRGEKTLEWVRAGTSTARMALNLMTGLVQLPGVVMGLTRRVGPKWMARGLAKLIGDAAHMENTAGWIHESSSFMRLRHKTFLREIREIQGKIQPRGSWALAVLGGKVAGQAGARAGYEVATGYAAVEDTFFWFTGKMQAVADITTWLGEYEKARANPEVDHDTAVALSDQAVIDLQGSGHIKDLAQAQRGTPALKLFSQFFTPFSVTFNQGSEAIGRTRLKDPYSVGRLGVDLLMLYTVSMLVEAGIRQAVTGKGGPDDDEPWLLWFAKNQASYMLNTVMFLREFSGAPFGYRYQGPAGAGFFAEGYNLALQAMQGDLDEAEIRALNQTAGILFHYPATELERLVRYFMALEDEGPIGGLPILFGKKPESK